MLLENLLLKTYKNLKNRVASSWHKSWCLLKFSDTHLVFLVEVVLLLAQLGDLVWDLENAIKSTKMGGFSQRLKMLWSKP